MKKFSFLLLGLFLLAHFSHGQKATKKLAWGFKLGLNGSNIRVENGTNSDWKTGLVTGFFANVKVGQRFSIQPEFLYSSMGGRNMQGDQTSLRMNYFSLPVLARYNLTNKFVVLAGPQVDVMILGKTKNSGGFEEVTNDFRENSFNVTGGAEYWLLKHLGISGRYIYGFNNILEAGSMKWKNQGVQLALAVKF